MNKRGTSYNLLEGVRWSTVNITHTPRARVLGLTDITETHQARELRRKRNLLFCLRMTVLSLGPDLELVGPIRQSTDIEFLSQLIYKCLFYIDLQLFILLISFFANVNLASWSIGIW